MQARALVCDADRDVTLRTVELPNPTGSDVVVDTSYSGVSIGTELNLIRGDVSWGPYPICTGYQAVGTVEAVGDDVSRFEVGDSVYYRDAKRGTLPGGKSISATAGTHASRAVIDPEESHGIGHLPSGIDEAVASTFVMPAVGFNGVNMAGIEMTDDVVVHGVGLIGLGVVAAARQRGARILAVDLLDERLDAASDLGAEWTVNVDGRDTVDAVREVLPDGADAVFETTGVPDCIDTALELTKQHGTFVFQGDYGDRDVSFYFRTPHHNRLTTYFPCDDGQRPARRAVLRNIADGVLPWGRVVTDRVDAPDAPALYDRLLEGDSDGVIGACVDWTTVSE